MRLFVVFLVFLLQLPLHAQGVFVKEMPNVGTFKNVPTLLEELGISIPKGIPNNTVSHYMVKRALKKHKIRVVDFIRDATLIVDGYVFYVIRLDPDPLTDDLSISLGCNSELKVMKPDGEIIYWIEVTGGLPSPKIKDVAGCAEWLIGEFHKEMKRKHKDLFVVISKEPAPK